MHVKRPGERMAPFAWTPAIMVHDKADFGKGAARRPPCVSGCQAPPQIKQFACQKERAAKGGCWDARRATIEGAASTSAEPLDQAAARRGILWNTGNWAVQGCA